ncbi:N-acetylglucosamine-6-sulfatase-like isoform X1 [Dysidea avara]|uniref:N-acetylglucosamine-6-sulfatase-like isoform X1 n=1 Tax=Dysidea avara TaxID=196820 RepID=UPI003328A87A
MNRIYNRMNRKMPNRLIFLMIVVPVFADSSKPPNFVFLFNDDQDLTLGGMTPMSRTLALMQDGIYLKNFFANSPLCCPSRAALVSGRYPHNYVSSDGSGCMKLNVSTPEFYNHTFPVYFKDHGYTVGAFGKLLNPTGTPACYHQPMPGVDDYLLMCNSDRYFNVSLVNANGHYISGFQPQDYLTAIVGNATVKFIEKALQNDKPFFAYIGPHAPHYPATPAPCAKDHHFLLRQQLPLDKYEEELITELFRDRWRSLLSVDDLMMDVVSMLTNHSAMDNTYFIWSSDHGYKLGQFCLPREKHQPYENDIRVPFFIKGPDIHKHKSLSEVVSMIDVAPTLLELAGIEVHPEMEGESFASLLTGKEENSWKKDKHIIEFWSQGDGIKINHYVDGPNNTFIGVRLLNESHNIAYLEFYENIVGEHEFNIEPCDYELFDLTSDPYQLNNLYNTPNMDRELVKELKQYLHQVVLCKGSQCHQHILT